MLIYLYAIAVVLLGIACTLCPIIGDYHVLKKMGESGWISLIPWYSLYVKYTKVWCRSAAVLAVLLALPLSFLRSYSSNPVILKLLFLSGIAFFAVRFIGNVKLSKRFGRGIPFALGLTFLPAVFAMILGFNSDRFIREKSQKNLVKNRTDNLI